MEGSKLLGLSVDSFLSVCVCVSQELCAPSALTYNAALIKNVLAMLLLIVCSPRALLWYQNILLQAIHLALNQPVSQSYLQFWHQQPQTVCVESITKWAKKTNPPKKLSKIDIQCTEIEVTLKEILFY